MDTPTSSLPVLLPDSSRLSVESVSYVDGAVAIVAFVTGDTASCPLCGVCSGHVHSRYGRTLRDLPLQGVSVRMSLRTRRFYCQSGDCRRKIFTEVPESHGIV
jgi:transposase